MINDIHVSILIVDDNPAKLTALSAALADMDIEIVTADSGTDALRKLLVQDFSVMLLDVNMPVMDGFATAEMVRSRPKSEHLPIIFVTAERFESRLQGYSLGAVDYILSPVLPQILRAKVAVFVDLYKMRIALREHVGLANTKAFELLHAKREAEQANRAKTDFLANMSHEIRSPLNAILGLAYLLEQSHLDQDAHSMVRKIRASGRMLLNLISDILDMSKIDAGQMVIEHALFRLDDVIDNVAVTSGVAVGEKDIELVISPLPKGVLCILGDSLRLEQVLINLVSNAVKFTQSGSIQVHTEVICSTNSHRMLRFSVIDTGIGIAPELQNGVFSAFTQADTSTTRRFGGTGLGLAICRQLVIMMGGEIGVNSSLGVGSEFWFTVPLLHANDPSYSSPGLVDVSVVIADDNAVALKAIADTAMNLGWQISAVDSGVAALACVLERKQGRLPDVVVLDWHMPGMDGLTTARLIRDRVSENECPIVIIASSHSHTSLSAQTGIEMVDAILHKPVTLSGLYNAVMEAQSRRTAKAGLLPVFSQATSDSLAGIRVLVVDDSDINREVAERILVGQGAVVSLAEDGQQAIDWLQAHAGEVDMVLMDVQMPVLDGIEATRRLRRIPQFVDLPIVALTAGAFKSQHDAALAAGITHFMSKPFDVPSTTALILRLCRPLSQTLPTASIRTPMVATVSTVAAECACQSQRTFGAGASHGVGAKLSQRHFDDGARRALHRHRFPYLTHGSLCPSTGHSVRLER